MKLLLTFVIWVASSLAMAQFPSLPYNPDENGDGFIGVVDLQGLLADYGSEFSSAIISEDGESAVVYMGEMGYYECKHSCNQLPGFWSLPSGENLVPVFSDLNADRYTYTWLSSVDNVELPYNRVPHYAGHSSYLNRGISADTHVGASFNCYCAAKQLPRVEYSYCRSGDEQPFSNCCQEKVENGWYPLSTTTGVSGNIYAEGEKFGQAFWRWAE